MNEIKTVTEWVEYKIGKFLADDIEKMINSESSSFNVEKYSQELYEEHFLGEVEKNIEEIDFSDWNLKLNLETDDLYLSDAFSDDSNDDNLYNIQFVSLDSIIQGLQNTSETAQIQALLSLQGCTTEELVIQNSWTIVRDILLNMIKQNESRNLCPHILELFRRFLLSNGSPKVVCEGFVSLTESIIFHIESINLAMRKNEINYAYDGKTNKWMHDLKSVGVKEAVEIHVANISLIFQSMWLLVESQKGIPIKWNRFNEKRLREIVFSFIHMLSSTKNLKNNDGICGLEILSVLDPRAIWVSNWSHGATGRRLLCSALKTYKKLFNEVIDFILIRIKTNDTRPGVEKNSTIDIKLPPLLSYDRKVQTRKDNQNNRVRRKNLNPAGEKFSARSPIKKNGTSAGNHSAPPFESDENLHGKEENKKKHHSDWIISGIPKEIVEEAKFCHCISMVVYLIQYRGGRSLFPLEVACRRRRMTIADFIESVVNYINELLFFTERNPITKDAFRKHMLRLLQILKSL